MKWASKSELFTFTYKIDMDILLSPIYHLVLDLLRGEWNDKLFREWVGEAFRTELIYGQDSFEDVTEESFLIDLARYLENHLYSNVSCLENSGVRLIYRNKNLLIAPPKPKPMSCIVGWIRNSGVIGAFLDLVKKPSINVMKDSLVKLMNEQYYGQSVVVSESGPLKGTFIKKKMVDNAVVKPIDNESIWLCKEWRTITEAQDDTNYGEVSIPDIDGYGISVGDYMISLEMIDQAIKPISRSLYFWKMLNNVYARRSKSASVFRERCQSFAEDLKKSDFALLMKNLQYNLYIRKGTEPIPESYRKYFEEVYDIEDYEDKTNQLLFTGCHEPEQIQRKQTMLGLYSTQKEGTEFNLRAWINVESELKQRMTKGDGDKEVRIPIVYALRPQYSYYFCKDYFEDMFADILKECSIVSLSNFELSRTDDPAKCYIEIDNMVMKQDGTLVYIENKTTMNRYNIEDTLNEVSKFHDIMTKNYPDVNIEYMMVSLYQNNTVEDGYSYFTNATGNSLADFKIPVSRFNGVNLHCVVEPEYEKLKAKMESLLK